MPSDWRALYKEGLVVNSTKRRFISFEPYAGFNNVRYQLETVFILAHILNRTLVLPPKFHIYLTKQPSLLEDYWDLIDMRKAIGVLTHEEYCREVGVSAEELLDFNTWGLFMEKKAVPNVPNWDMQNQVLVFPSAKECEKSSNHKKYAFPDLKGFAAEHRIRNLLEISQEMIDSDHMHFKTRDEHRLFGIYYTFIYFADARWYSFYVSLARKYLHYRSEISDAAEYVAEQILFLNSSSSGFGAMHLRRGDFAQQYSFTQIDPKTIAENVDALFEPKFPMYISSDESNDLFYKIFETNYIVYRRKDLERMLREIRDSTKDRSNPHFFEVLENENFYGAIEQMICFASRTFVGTPLSTFTGFIHRMRAFYPHTFALSGAEAATSGVYDKNWYMNNALYIRDPVADGHLTNATWVNDPSTVRSNDPLWGREFKYGLYPFPY
jgi:hypothetical protein